jgi:hypothetical protein
MTDESALISLAGIPEDHQNAVIGLAATEQLPIEFVADAYRRELNELKQQARITHYLPVLATRRVRQRLRKRRKT